jgi:hypothetical protein
VDFSIEEYYESIQKNIGNLYTFKQLENGYIQVRTPYHYPDGSVIDVYIKGTTVTDLGETVRTLENCYYAGASLKNILVSVENNIYIDNCEIYIKDCDFIYKGVVMLTEALIIISNSIFTDFINNI